MIIGITGKKGHGKDTVGALLRRYYGFRLTAYAEPLKAAARIIYGLTDEQVNGPLSVKEAVDPRWGLSPREILQRLGTEVGRGIHPETWIRSAMLRIEADPGRWAITDARFPNEAQAIRDRGGIILRVDRPGASTGAHEAHASEVEIDAITPDYTLVNSGTISDLDMALAATLPDLRTAMPPRRRP